LRAAHRLHEWSGMKKSTSKLTLKTQTLRLLSDDAIRHVVGGTADPQGFIMKDSIIVKTSTRIVATEPYSQHC
jgi:hypothetical protein